MLDKKLIFLLRKKGHTQKEIGDIVGVSRQRIHQIIKNYTTTSYKSKHKLKILENNCIICRDKATIIHHIDYDSHNNNKKNLIAVCHKCHMELHRGRKRDTIRHYDIHICQWCNKKFEREHGYSGGKMKYCSYKCRAEGTTLKNIGKWSTEYSECIICSTTKTAHGGMGMCKNCYARMSFHRRKEEL